MKRRAVAMIAVLSLTLAACVSSETTASDDTTTTAAPTSDTTTTVAPTSTTTTTTTVASTDDTVAAVEAEALLPAYIGGARFQDVAEAEAAGWVNTAESLGCFENPGVGGMGVHWLNESLVDAEVDPGMPEALVYELDATGEVAALVGHEYLIPLDAWTAEEPPTLFGRNFEQHSVLPFWALHANLWKDNPMGMFNDWNPAVRMCPDGVGVFGVDLPADG